LVQAYFINDEQPVNQTAFLVPLIVGLGRSPPTLWLPVALMLPLAFAVQWLCLAVWAATGWLPDPLLLPAEVIKVGVTHTFSTAKARREIGYRPLVAPDRGMRETVKALLENTSKHDTTSN
jgi:nucleoside-diphosphate-sugar epimerase